MESVDLYTLLSNIAPTAHLYFDEAQTLPFIAYFAETPDEQLSADGKNVHESTNYRIEVYYSGDDELTLSDVKQALANAEINYSIENITTITDDVDKSTYYCAYLSI